MGQTQASTKQRTIDVVSGIRSATSDTLKRWPTSSLDTAVGVEWPEKPIMMDILKPIREELERLDAESFLKLQRVKENGARLRDGVQVKPIHDVISPQRKAAIRYLRVADHTDYSIGVFVFPPHSRMPLHDHPHMCVVTRLLYGTVERVQFDTCPDEPPTASHRLLARRRNPPDLLQAPACTELFPNLGNIHSFTAGPQGAALLDVLLPPYNDDDRDCMYYEIEQELEDGDGGGGGCYYLTRAPDVDFDCVSGRYLPWEDDPPAVR